MEVSVHVRNCTLHLFLGSWLKYGDSSLMIVEFLEVTFSRHGTRKRHRSCDTSLALARSSPTRRYTGIGSILDFFWFCWKQSFAFRFPTEEYYRRNWLAACGLSTVPRNGGVCEAHFEAEAYHRCSGRSLLKKDALPNPNVSFYQCQEAGGCN